MQFGGNIGIVRDPRVSLEHSFSVGKGATNWMSPTGFANTGSPLDPANVGLAEPGSVITYDYPVLGLMGLVSDIVGNYNYDKQLNVLPAGTPVKRNYGLEWYEFYGQDSWRVKSNLTVTFGLRWSLFPPPWEVNGFQASPAVNLGQQFNQTVKNMDQGIGYDSVRFSILSREDRPTTDPGGTTLRSRISRRASPSPTRPAPRGAG